MSNNNINDVSDRDSQINSIAKQYDYSPFMIEQLMINYPDDYLSVIRAMDKTPLNTIRVNTLTVSPSKLKNNLEQKGFQLKESKWIDYAFQIDGNTGDYQIGATHEYLLGQYYLQSLASMIPPHLLFPQKGDNIIDMCAAPGSKTTQLAQLIGRDGTIIAIDMKASRLNSLISNIKRCGVNNAIVFPYDAKKLQSVQKLYHWADKILLDAPCTGSGIIRKDKTRKKSRDMQDIKIMSKHQKQLLRTGLHLLKPGGRLMYSTCSFHYQENESVVSEVVKSIEGINIIEPPLSNIGLPGMIEAEGKEFGYDMLKSRRLYPNLHDTDAFFYCLMEKVN